MPLKYYYEKESDVPAEHKALYHEKKDFEVKKDVKQTVWMLDVEGVVARDRFIEFRDSNVAMKRENDELKEKFKDISDPDKARALLSIAKDVEVEDAEKVLKKGGVDAMVAERTKAIKADLEGKLSVATERGTKLQSELDRTIIENAIMGACSKISLQPGAEMAILRLADGFWSRRDGQLVALDKNGNPKNNKEGTGNLGLSEWLEGELLKQHPYLIKESTGGGATGGAGGAGGSGSNINPWAKETWNLTQQGRILREDKDKARRMAKQHGHRIPGD